MDRKVEKQRTLCVSSHKNWEQLIHKRFGHITQRGDQPTYSDAYISNLQPLFATVQTKSNINNGINDNHM